MIITISNQKGGVGKTTTAANLAVLLARQYRRVLVLDSDPQFALTRQLGAEERSLGVNLVDVLTGRAAAADAIVPDIHRVDLIAAAPALAGVEMSLVGELGRERFLTDALEPLIAEYDDIVLDTPPTSGCSPSTPWSPPKSSSRPSAPRTTRRFTGSASYAKPSESSPTGSALHRPP